MRFLAGGNKLQGDIADESGTSTTPMLLVTANPITGTIFSLTATQNCSTSFKTVGFMVARSMLVIGMQVQQERKLQLTRVNGGVLQRHYISTF